MKFTNSLRTSLYTTVGALLLTLSSFAQAPEKMSYQAVIRGANNALVTNQQVGMQISILQGSKAVYEETQTPTSNTNGLVSLEIGTGTVISGSFTAIDWSAGTYFIKTETDPTGGTNYTITGTSQLLSVPFALYATTSSDAGAVAANTAKVGYTEELVSANTDVAANTLKVGITAQQASDITSNNAKTGITSDQATAISTNTSNIATNATDIATNVTAIALNTAKDTNVSTDLTITGTTGARVIVSSDGTDATIPVATSVVSGVMSKATYDEHLVNTAKTGITTDQATAISTNTSNIATNVTDILTNASGITTNATDIATNVTDIALKANIVSPTLTGTPLAPTATAGDSSTAIATTAFVTTAVSTATSGSFVDLTTDQTIAGSKTFSDNTSVGGTLDVTGDTSVNTFDSSGATSLATGGGVVNVASSGVMTTVIGTLNVDEAVTLDTTLGVTGVATLSAQPILSTLTASLPVFSDGSKGLVSNAITGSGSVVMSASPTLIGTPTLPTGTIATTQTAGNSTTAIATTAFVTTAVAATHAIGDSYGGGIVFFVYDGGQHGLIVAREDQSEGIRWYGGSYTNTRARADGIGAGLKNTAIIIANQGPVDSESEPFAATVCNEYSVTEDDVTYGDWYLPSKHELNLLYIERVTVVGLSSFYWSSTEVDSENAWGQSIFGLGPYESDKNDTFNRVRAVRAF